jgi:hypothetical protein
MAKIHHHLLRYIQARYFFAAFVIFAVIAVFALRDNNLHMVQLREAVYTADKNNGDIEGALQDLRTYVTGHMNTSLSAGNNTVYPPIQLKYTYERLVEAAGAQAANGNTTLYADAQKYCEKQIPTGFSGSNRLACIEQYIDAHGAGSNPVPNIPDSLYKFDFASPRWSPDLAGLSIVAAIICLLVGLLDLSGHLITKHLAKK